MRIGILTKRANKLAEKIKSYYESQGHIIKIYTPNNLYINESLLENDFYILKSKKLSYLYAACYLKRNGVHVIPDPDISYKQRNKREAHLLIEELGLNAPQFYTGTTAELKNNLRNEEYPVILKPIMGSGGVGIKVIKSKKDFTSKDDKMIFIEKFIHGTHYNVSFIGKEICTYEKPPLSPNDVLMECIPTANDIQETVNKWRKSYKILFGHLDIVREEESNSLYIVDVGPFPQFLNWEYDENPAPKICNLFPQFLNWEYDENPAPKICNLILKRFKRLSGKK